MNTGVLSYFNKAFFLINKSWSLFAFYLLLSLLYSFPEFLADSAIKSLLSVVGFFIMILQIGFSFSLPLFLVEKQEEKSITLKSLLLVSLRSTKRLILPLILFFIIFIVVFIIGFILTVQFIYGGDFDFMTKIQGFNLWNLFFALIIGLFSFLTFTPIYFSLEKDRLLSSIKKSFTLSFQHLNFIIILIILNALLYLIFSTFLNTNQNIYHSLISNIIYAYLDLIIGAASLYLYQNKKYKSSFYNCLITGE